MCIFTSIEVFPTQETLPVNLMSQSGYIILLHKSTTQTLEAAGSLTPTITKTGFSKTFLCSASGNTHKVNPEKTVVASDHTASLQFSALSEQENRRRNRSQNRRKQAHKWQTHSGVQQNTWHKQDLTPPEQKLFNNEPKKLVSKWNQTQMCMKFVFWREGKCEIWNVENPLPSPSTEQNEVK